MRDKILSFIREKGPVVPTDVSSFLRIDSVIASAYLSELVSSKIIKISSIKFGTSPLYYLQEQKKDLEKFKNGLNQQEKTVFEELKLKKILKEADMLPPLRVAIKNIKDFAIPLEVSFQDKQELFWKWYELTNEEASPLIKAKLYGAKEIDVERKLEDVNKELKKVLEETVEVKKEVKKEKDVKKIKEFVKEKVEEKKEKETNVEKTEEKSIAEFTDDKFAIKVIQQLKERKVKISSLEVEKKNSELNLVIEVPTGVGEITFYCKAKDKKRLNDIDVSSAFAEGYLKKLPVLLVSTGVLTKKGQERLEKDFKSVVFLAI